MPKAKVLRLQVAGESYEERATRLQELPLTEEELDIAREARVRDRNIFPSSHETHQFPWRWL